jgi:hypothetical protein
MKSPPRYYPSMTDTQAETHVNGTAPAPPAETAEAPCEDCTSGGEKALAVLAGVFGLFILLMAADMFTGGKISGLIRPAAEASR